MFVPMQPQMFNRGPASWRPHNTYQQQPMANQISMFVPMQNQMFLGGPSSWRPHNTYHQNPMPSHIPIFVPMQNQMFNRGPASAPWRGQNTYQQHPMGGSRFIPWHVLYQLPNFQMTPILDPFLSPTDREWPVAEQRVGMRPIYCVPNPVMYPYQRPEAANPLNLRMPQFRSEDVFTTISPDGLPRSVAVLGNGDHLNLQQDFFLLLDTALVVSPGPVVNHLVQLHIQTQQQMQAEEVHGPASSEQGGDQQQPTQSQEVDGPASSEQGGDQQQPTQSQEVDGPASSEQGGDQQQPR
ncbi:hypothetical protein CARUB_v10001599mg [Capsella rubella]|uniref:Uncharacterized protein n=1 Tax=Capsella rubella TaxID=81985 RepID=R0GWF5_9BRAS|nr:hypothetical protein CARUB_v10001599mg [Capsella rubella]